MTEASSSSVPVVDIRTVGLCSADEPTAAAYADVGKRLVEALSDTGFAYVTNHGITEESVEHVFRTSMKFFNLTEEQKKAIPIEDCHGYSGISNEKLSARHHNDSFEKEIRESFNIRYPDGQLPDSTVPEFRPAVCSLIGQIMALCKRIMQSMDYGLGIEPGFFVKKHTQIFTEENLSGLRVLHYPPVPSDAPPNVTRCSEHTDYGTITMQVQDDMGGLEVRSRSGEWVIVPTLPGAILVYGGDLLQVWTNNRIVATRHRVRVPDDERKKRFSRQSVVFFLYPDYDVDVTSVYKTDKSAPVVNARKYQQDRLSESFLY